MKPSRGGWRGTFGVRPAEMLLTNGVDDALRLIMDTFVEPGSSVLIPEPTFSMYRFFSEVAGARIESVRYDRRCDFRWKACWMLRAWRARVAMSSSSPIRIIPPARCCSRAALRRILDAATADAGAGG